MMTVTRPLFSANLGFLWKDLPLTEAVRLAAAAGFDAVEFHQPFATPVEEISEVLADVDLPLISINMGVGDQSGDFGLAAIPGREAEARALIDEAVAYAASAASQFVSIIAGRSGRTDEAERTFRENLAYAADQAGERGCSVVIEPLNVAAGSDYHLLHVRDAVETIEAVGASNLHVMADTFHVMTMEGDLTAISEHLDAIGHIQFSGWPDRGEPDHAGPDQAAPDQGIDFASVLPAWIGEGYEGCYGAEYTPRISESEGLAWLHAWH